MFDKVAPRYDLMNTILSLGQADGWREATVAAIDPRPGEHILDLAAGTGTSSKPLQAAGASVVAADLSMGMLIEGRARQPEVSFVNADALNLPFASGSFDCVTISFGLRNIPDTLKALREMRRVTKPGGRLVVCEFSTPTWLPFRRLYRDYLMKALPPLAKLASANPAAYSYLAESIATWPDQAGLANVIGEANWRTVEWKNLSGGIVALHRGWN
ncbi:enoyl-CoA hydratase [Platysternon megacephalum]|uniref:2-methoxy-6-polyprenyl-1,4-benzoquinol methylase, mitochondrial n=1 Tax=Platysternon megacephalum TaxID=55544 RepID=A0A4D9DAZ6_9SAUR|nr:enoyl-CoA hydratase [Platysternon megacephalum]